MSGSQTENCKCSKCEKNIGLHEYETRTGEEWFLCRNCGWGYELNVRRFGSETLAELRELLQDKGSDNIEPRLERILTDLLSKCQDHGLNRADYPVNKLEDMLKRSMLQWKNSDWWLLHRLTKCDGLIERKDGKFQYDYIESTPKVLTILFRN